MAPTIKEILLYAKNEGASDVHVTVGIPPKMRVNGELVSMPFERMLPADTMELLSVSWLRITTRDIFGRRTLTDSIAL